MKTTDLIGTMHFDPVRDESGKPVSTYRGVIAGLIIRRDDGSEYEVRSTKVLPNNYFPLSKRDLYELKPGNRVSCLIDEAKYEVVRAFPQVGDVQVRDNTGCEQTKKYFDLRRIDG